MADKNPAPDKAEGGPKYTEPVPGARIVRLKKWPKDVRPEKDRKPA